MSDVPSSSTSNKGIKRALLIGLRYDQPQMIYTYKDCKKVEEFLVKEFKFPRNEIKTLRDFRDHGPCDAILTNLKLDYEITQFIKETKSGDVSVLYVSGHGANPESTKGPGPGLIGAADYEVVDVDDITKDLSNLPDDCKFLVLIDACYGANFIKTFNEKLVMFISSQETEETTANKLEGSHFTNAFLHTVVTHRETTITNVFDIIKKKLRSAGIDQTPIALCGSDKRDIPISQLFDH